MEKTSTFANREGVEQHQIGTHIMRMWFHFGYNEVILLSFCTINSIVGLLLACLIIFVLALVYEALKWFRVKLGAPIGRKPLQWSMESKEKKGNGAETEDFIERVHVQSCSQQDVYAPTTTSPSNSLRAIRFPFGVAVAEPPIAIARILEVFLYAVQLLLAYCLMLIVMTFNIWLILAVVTGATVGHWLFAAL